MILPNPFFESALAPAMVADDGHWPATADPADPVAVTFTGPALSIPCGAETAAVIDAPVAAASSEENYIPELFSAFAYRRCMPIISPPLPQQCRREFEPDMDALFDAIVPPEPPPLFIRKPSQAFMRALFELSH